MLVRVLIFILRVIHIWCKVNIYLHVKMDSEVRLRTKPYDKRDYFNFSIVNLIFIYVHVVTFDQVVPVCEEYITHLIR
jgi:hypothetical protein